MSLKSTCLDARSSESVDQSYIKESKDWKAKSSNMNNSCNSQTFLIWVSIFLYGKYTDDFYVLFYNFIILHIFELLFVFKYLE